MFKYNNYTYIEKLFGITVKSKYKKEIKERLFLYIETHLNNSTLSGYELIKYSASIINNISEEINDEFLKLKKEEILLFFNPIWFEQKEKEIIDKNKLIKLLLINVEKKENKIEHFIKSLIYENIKENKKQKTIRKELTKKEKETYEILKNNLINKIEEDFVEIATFQTYKDNIREFLEKENIKNELVKGIPEINSNLCFATIGYFNLLKIKKEEIGKLKNINIENLEEKYPSFYFYLKAFLKIREKLNLI